MPDLVEDERLANLFLTFRAEAGAEIRPPGSETARRTVRRRRSARMGGAAALAIVALGAVGLVSWPGPGGSTVGGDPPAIGPALRLAELERLGVDALAVLGYAPTDSADPVRPETDPAGHRVRWGRGCRRLYLPARQCGRATATGDVRPLRGLSAPRSGRGRLANAGRQPRVF